MKTWLAVVISLFAGLCFAQVSPDGRWQTQAAYPESETAAAWRDLSASYLRRAARDRTLDKDTALKARVDAVMAAVGAAAAATDSRFAKSSWKAFLIENFGHGAAAFPGETILIDANFVRSLQLSDEELALVLSHEVAHIVAGHASARLSFMAELVGMQKLPTARSALDEFFAKGSYATVFQPKARIQEREADTIGAGILLASGYDPQRALGLFEKLERREGGHTSESHDNARTRKQTISEALARLQQSQARRAP